MERARSLPASRGGDGVVTNPFYSKKVQEDMAVRALRPADLPGDDSSLDATPEPVRDEGWHGGTGKGRGAASSGPGKTGSSFVTPPSREVKLQPGLEGHGKKVKQSQGQLQPETGDQTMGSVHGAPMESGSDDLKLALEKEMFEYSCWWLALCFCAC